MVDGLLNGSGKGGGRNEGDPFGAYNRRAYRRQPPRPAPSGPPSPWVKRGGIGPPSGVGGGVAAVGGRLEFGSELHDPPGGERGLGVYRKWLNRLKMQIALDAEAEAEPY